MLKSKDLKGWKVSLDFCFIQLSASAETAGTNPGSRQLGQVSQWRQSPTPRCPQNFRLFQKLLHQLMPGYTTDVGQDQKFQSVTTPSSTVCSPLTHNMSDTLLSVWLLGFCLHILHLHSLLLVMSSCLWLGKRNPKLIPEVLGVLQNPWPWK